MRKIVVALDGSPGSEKALQMAVKMAQTEASPVTAVSVLDRSGDPHLEHLVQDAKKNARQQLEEMLKAAASFARARGVLLTPVYHEGHPAEMILACAEQEGADLLVFGKPQGWGCTNWLGRHGRPGEQSRAVHSDAREIIAGKFTESPKRTA
jgi:nucleotide-binding universal stress UspA family protein